MAEQSLTDEMRRCIKDMERAGQCPRSDCRCPCHEDQEFSFVYGWAPREGYDQRSGDDRR